ncbi:MAG: hypothetical protein E7256_10865 [Lachnospiraceae bacterium]|nr:hypothetical protein [Lachnospiraceae bacterium]
MKKKVISILCGTMFVILAGSLYFVTKPDQTEAIMLTNASEEADLDLSLQEKTTLTDQPITDESQTEKDSEVTISVKTPKICIYVCGAVKTPGVYYLSEEARAVQAIDAAGGFTGQADKEYVNLARAVSDGEKLYVPTLEETEEMAFSSLEEAKQNEAVSEEGQAKSSGKVNINTAGKEELMTLNGIGEAKAESIISYRDANGPFQCKEDIMNITGIKDALYQKIADYICVTNEK